MKCPSKIKVGYKDIAIDLVRSDFSKQTDSYGEYQHRANKIEIQQDLNNIDFANTLLHEVLHAVAYEMSLTQEGNILSKDTSEEIAINSITNGLMTVFRDNPWFLKFMQEYIHGRQSTRPTND
tara:strand:+ start:1541 stop:1909 length:369 start_codon:yes stop_codon:yes gene_type:complete